MTETEHLPSGTLKNQKPAIKIFTKQVNGTRLFQ